MQTVAIGIFCKTPAPGHSKTRLSPPLRPDECAAISACFIRDLTATVAEVARDGASVGYAVYTPVGTEIALRTLLPPGFRLLPQCEGDFGVRLMTATRELLRTHAGAIMVNADSPTLPASILSAAVSATRRGNAVVLSPALDGGYTLIGVSKTHPRLYQDVPWSTAAVFQKTVERAAEIGVPVVTVPGWYDVDDAASLAILESELAGEPPFADAFPGADAPATRAHLMAREAPLRARICAVTIVAAPAARQDSSALIGLCLAGCVLLALAAAAPWIVRALGYAVFIPALAASGLVTIFATRCAVNVPARIGLLMVFGFALAMRLVLVGIEPLLSTDLYRYIWDGRVQAAGINPYLYVPVDPALAALRDAAIYPHINRADYAITAYPPVAEMVFLAITRLAETATALRLAMVACEIAIVAVVIDLLRRLGLPVTAVVAYAWHPLAVWEVANNGHVEALMVALMMLAIWLLMRAQRVGGAIAVTLAALAKPYAVLILPVFWRPWDWRVPLAIVVIILICYLPYLGAGTGVFGFLGQGYLAEEGFVSGSSIWLVALLQAAVGIVPGLVPIYAALAAAIMVALGLRYRFDPARTPRETIGAVIALLTAGLILMSPNYAWYFFALVPFIPLGAGAPAWALTLGAFLLYRPIFFASHNELIWKSLATVPFVLALAFVLSRKQARNAAA